MRRTSDFAKGLACIIAVSFLLGFVFGWAFAQPADAQVSQRNGDPLADTRDCVANREANSLHQRLGRTVLERRWEVSGMGEPVNLPGFGPVITYPWCDHSSDSWVGVIYNQRRAAVVVIWYSAEDQVAA